MRQLRALIYKEWRDQRALVLGMYLLCILTIIVARVIAGTRFHAQFRETIFLPACLAAVVIALTVEVVARDWQSGVDGSLSRLPCAAERAWLAKITFVVLASFVCVVLLGSIEAGILLAEKRPALEGLRGVVPSVGWLELAAVAAACHATAVVLRRSLPAALLGVALVVGIPLAATMLPIGRATELVDLLLASWTQGEFALLLCAAFLLGSLLARRVRRPDALGWRRAAGAALGVSFVLGPAFANSVRLGQWAFDIVPFSRSAEVEIATPSPDGRFIAMQVRQVWTPRQDWLPLTSSRTATNARRRCEVWILDSQTGEVREIDGRFRAIPMERPWDAQGHLATISTPGAFGDGEYTAERIDPVTAKVVASHPESGSDQDDYRYGLDRWLERTTAGEERVYSWRGTGFEVRLPPDIRPVPSTEPGVMFHFVGGSLVRHEFEGDSIRTLVATFEPASSWFDVSPDGRYLCLRGHSPSLVIDAHDGHVVHEFQRLDAGFHWSHIPGRIGSFYSCRSGGSVWQMLREDGSLQELPRIDWRFCEYGPDCLLEMTPCGVSRVRIDGTERRVLYEAHR